MHKRGRQNVSITKRFSPSKLKFQNAFIIEAFLSFFFKAWLQLGLINPSQKIKSAVARPGLGSIFFPELSFFQQNTKIAFENLNFLKLKNAIFSRHFMLLNWKN
jgi:hypothetical protein